MEKQGSRPHTRSQALKRTKKKRKNPYTRAQTRKMYKAIREKPCCECGENPNGGWVSSDGTVMCTPCFNKKLNQVETAP